MPRRARLKPEDFEIIGIIEGRRGRIWFRDRVGARVNHSDDCRIRIETTLDEDDEGEARLKKAQERHVHRRAEEVEKEANADTTYEVDKQGVAAEDVKIVNGEGEAMADGNTVEHNNGTTDGSAGSAAKFEDTYEAITR